MVRTGFNHCAAIDENGTMLIWGNNGSGSLGNGGTFDSSIPQPLSFLSQRFWGDVDNDGSVNINDVTAIQQYAAELGEPDYEGLLAGDVNGDGITNIDDATEIQRFLAEMIDRFPVERK